MNTEFEFVYKPIGPCRFNDKTPTWARWTLILLTFLLVLELVGLMTPSRESNEQSTPIFQPLPIASGGNGQRDASTSGTPVGLERK